MKKFNFFLLLLISMLFCFCTKSSINERKLENGFNLYLLKDSTLTATQIVETTIDNLMLANTPLFNSKDMLFYKWSDHTFSIDSNIVKSIGAICKRNITVSGIPFIITVNHERIYLGTFWFMHSSKAPFFPYIDAVYDFQDIPDVLTIHKSRDSSSIDLREDIRIYNVLKENGIILE